MVDKRSILDGIDEQVGRVMLRMANAGPYDQAGILKEELTAAFKLGVMEGKAE